MHSSGSSKWLLPALGLSLFGIQGCGLLGEKNLPEQSSNVSATGCLNDSKDLVNRYLDGSLSQNEWNSAFDCINKSVDFFTDFVRGSADEGYTQADMYNLMSKFLITNGKVRKDLMTGAFYLKSALFGGDTAAFKMEEVQLLKTALARLRDITGDLIPYLKIRQNPNATYEELLELGPAFKRAGDQLADFINTLPTNSMSSRAMDLLFEELTYTLELEPIDALGEKVSLAKWLMFNSRRDAFENQDWARIFRSAFGLGGVWITLKTALGNDPDAPRAQVFTRIGEDYQFREFLWELGQQVRPFIDESLAQHQGITPLPIFDHLIDALPKGMLDNVPKQVMKDAIRPFVLRLLQSKAQTGVDRFTVDNLYRVFEMIIVDLGRLDRFYQKAGLDAYDVPPPVLNTALQQYEESLSGDERSQFRRIKNSLLIHGPMMFKDTGFIRYDNSFGYSKLQAQIVVAFMQFIAYIHESYGSGPDHFIESDFTAFFKDYTPILFAFQMIDQTVARFGEKRFQDLDLFTPISNGDKKASYEEVTAYAMMLISAGKMTSNMKREIGAACPEDRGIDLMGTRWVSPVCFRRNFHDRLEYWLTYFPRMKTYWSTLGVEDRARAMRWLEHGARRNGFTVDAPASNGSPATVAEDFGSFDFQSMAVVIHYTESLFTRFDKNMTEALSKAEINAAYDLFKILIQKKAQETVGTNISSDFLLKGIFSYIVRYREMPTVKLNDLGSTGKFGWWLLIYALPTTNYGADRLGVFNIVCQLAAPDSQAQADRTKTICLP
jgi:hypothetical protein